MKLQIKIFLLILNLVSLNCFAQFGPGTNNLWSVSNLLTQFKYDGKPNQAFTNTVNFTSLTTNTPWIRLYIQDDTNEFYYLIGTNNNIYLMLSNSTSSSHNILAISNDIAGNFSLWSESGIELGKTPDLGFQARRWRIHGLNSLFDGATYGFFSPTNITVQAINVSGNVDTQNTFTSPNVTTPGMYEVSCTAVVTQTCLGASLRLGVIASNSFGFMTNWMFNQPMPLTAITNMSGSIVTSNVNFSLANEFLVTGFSSGTALGYVNWFVRQLQ